MLSKSTQTLEGKRKLLIVDDQEEYLKSLRNALKADFVVLTASNTKEAKTYLPKNLDLVLLDIRLKDHEPRSREGVEFLKEIKRDFPNLPVIMMTAYGEIDLAVDAMKLGASDFLQKAKIDLRELKKIISQTIERSKLERKVSYLEQELDRTAPWEIVGESAAIHEVKNVVDMVAQDGQVTVLIRGESGTGKELVARAIHRRGVHKDGPFVAVSLAERNKEIISDDLFGHERGAFTSAADRREGFIEQADGGILFLDEIGDIPLDTQAKLLRVIEERSFTRLGSSTAIEVDIQLVTATNQNLEELVKQKKFRQDLYFRIKGMEIRLPLLEQRREDIPLLAEHFVALQKGKAKVGGIFNAALKLLQAYSWPGNVRELKMSVESAIMWAGMRHHLEIQPEDLPAEIRDHKEMSTEVAEAPAGEEIRLDRELAKYELSLLEEALKKSRGKKTEAWKLLGLNDRFALIRRVNRIRSLYPELVGEFPAVRNAYAKVSRE